MKLFFILCLFLIPANTYAQAKHSLYLGSSTLHGFPNRNGAWEGMPRKLDSKGQMVITPGIGYMYSYEWNFQTSLLKDCYDNWAGTLLAGKDIMTNEYIKVGWLAGMYWRQAPYYINRFGQNVKSNDSLPMIEYGANQYIPLAFISIEFTPKERIKPVIMTNGVLTNFAIKIDF